MATLNIIRWHEEAIGFTAWDSHARSELKKRLKRAVDASPSTLKEYARQIGVHELIVIRGVKDDALRSLLQILETQGADVAVHQEPR